MFKYVVLLLACMMSLQGATLKERTAFIESTIEKTIETADPTAQVGIQVISLKDDLVYERNAGKRYVPGSSLKLFVAAAAFDLLGPDYRFETRIVADGKVKAGELLGNCYLIASGDPSLDVEGLEEIVQGLKEQGVDRIKGDLVLDLSVFDDVELGPGWMWNEEPGYWCSPLGALNLEHNCVSFSLKPGSEVGRPCYVDFYPQCGEISVVNRSVTRKSGETAEVRRLYDGRFEVVGVMGLGDELMEFKLPVLVPHLFVADVMKALFKQNQIAFEGDVKVGMCVKHVTELGVHRSEPLSELMKVVLKMSDNLYADAIFKKVGQARYGSPGTWQKGSKAVRELLASKAGLDVDEMIVLDGCGLSRYNLVSPKQMVTFLKWVHESFTYREELKASLAIGGVDGTLKRRMKAPFLMSKVRAKSGSMTGVSALCGYVEDDVAFAIFVNGYVKSGREIKRKIEDEVCHVLVNSGL